MPLDPSPDAALRWTLIDGAYETELAPGPPAADRADCNAYLLRTPEYVLVLDPGAAPARGDALADVLSTLTRGTGRNVVVFLTHCHADHCLCARRILDEPELSASLACHDMAAETLRGRGPDRSGAEILGLCAPSAPRAMGLFGRAEGGVARDMRTPGGGLKSLAIPIGTRDAIQVYHTPGHSPDSLCFRVGGALFAGDVACDEEPGLPELPGRDPQRQAETLGKLLWLMDHANITTVYPGHGPGMPRARAVERFRSLLSLLPPAPGPARP